MIRQAIRSLLAPRAVPPAQSKSPSVVISPSVPSAVWIEVGAHLGEKTFPVASEDSTLRVYAFEPILRLALQRAGLLANYIVLPLAVGEQDGPAEFLPQPV